LKIQSFNNNFLLIGLRYLQIVFLSALFLYFGKSLFIPLSFGVLIAFIAYPICKWLEHKRWPRSMAIGVVILVVIILFCLLLALLGYELNIFLRDMPRITDKIGRYSPEIQIWLEKTFGIGANTNRPG